MDRPDDQIFDPPPIPKDLVFEEGEVPVFIEGEWWAMPSEELAATGQLGSGVFVNEVPLPRVREPFARILEERRGLVGTHSSRPVSGTVFLD